MQRSGNGEEEKYSRCFPVGACGVRMPFVCAIQFLTTLIRIPTYIVGDLFQGFAKIMVMCAASRFFVLPLQNTGTGVLAWSAPPLLSSC